MRFDPTLTKVRLLRRYKRFLADVECADGKRLTVHCPNPGSMLGLARPGAAAWISDSGNPKRKLRHTLELVDSGGALVGIHTGRANRLAREAIEAGIVPGIGSGAVLKPEQRYGERSRVDFLVETPAAPPLFIEVKSVTLSRRAGLCEFPDAKTTRGARHLAELANMVAAGNRAMLLYIIQREDGDELSIAGDIDPAYRAAMRTAEAAGVAVNAIACRITPEAITPLHSVPLSKN